MLSPATQTLPLGLDVLKRKMMPLHIIFSRHLLHGPAPPPLLQKGCGFLQGWVWDQVSLQALGSLGTQQDPPVGPVLPCRAHSSVFAPLLTPVQLCPASSLVPPSAHHWDHGNNAVGYNAEIRCCGSFLQHFSMALTRAHPGFRG